MLKRFAKNIISILVTGICFFCLSFTAFADPLTGALIPVLDAIGVIVGGSSLTPGIVDSVLGDPSRTDIPIELNGSHVTYTPNAVEIDGIEFDKLIYSSEFAAFLQDQGFDWLEANGITSDSEGIVASGEGFVFGIPVFYFDGQVRSQNFVMSDYGNYGIGQLDVDVVEWTTNYPYKASVTFNGSPLGGDLTARDVDLPFVFYVYGRHSGGHLLDGNGTFLISNGAGRTATGSAQDASVASQFEFDWLAGTIDLTPLDGQTLEVLVPHGYIPDSVPSGDATVGIDNSIIDTIHQALIDALVHLEEIIGEFVDPPVPPPTPTPIPTDDLGSVPYPAWLDTFGNRVNQGIQNINDTIGLFKDSVEDFFDTVGQGIQDALEDMFDLVGLFKDGVLDALDTWGQSIEDAIDDLGTLVNTGITSLRQILEAIRTAVASIPATLTQILEHIKQGHLDLFKGVLDAIKVVFAPILIALKSALRLWHYVVEWVQATAPVFSTFIGFMSGTSYNMVLPIYAALAGPICIAIYKRFGR